MKKQFIVSLVFLILLAFILFSCGGGGGSENAIEDTVFSIGYNANGADSGTAPAIQKGNGKDVLTVSANTGNLAKGGYLFDGWNSSADGSGTDYAPGALYNGKNITLYAKWGAIFFYQIIAPGSPAPALDGLQKVSASYSAVITGLTARGKALSDIDIPETIDGFRVTAIGAGAFQNCNNLVNITIPYTVMSIGDNAFHSCSNMANITLQSNVPPALGTDALTGCPVLISVPISAIDTYKNTTGWEDHAASIITPETYLFHVTYDSNGAESGDVPLQQVGPIGHILQLSDNIGNLQKTGYTFMGWNTRVDGSGADYAAGSSYTITGEVILYAKWNISSCTVTYDGNGNTSGSVPNSQTADYNSIITLRTNTGNLQKTGYAFMGWNTKADGSGTDYAAESSYTITGSITLYAKWHTNSYTLKYAGNGNTSGSAPNSQTADYNSIITLRTNTGNLQKTGYAFIGWNTRADGAGTDYAAGSSYTITEGVTLYAKWISLYIEKANLEVGDIVLQNGKYVSYATFETYTTECMASSSPAGVVCYKGETDNCGISGKVYMVGLNQGSSLMWAPKDTTGYNTLFSTSYTAGEGNWAVIRTADPTGSANAATLYPAFNYANTYSVTGYTSGWFLPSARELSWIYHNETEINRSISTIIEAGGTATTLLSVQVWSSSQNPNNYTNAYWYKNGVYGLGKGNEYNVRVVRFIDD